MYTEIGAAIPAVAGNVMALLATAGINSQTFTILMAKIDSLDDTKRTEKERKVKAEYYEKLQRKRAHQVNLEKKIELLTLKNKQLRQTLKKTIAKLKGKKDYKEDDDLDKFASSLANKEESKKEEPTKEEPKKEPKKEKPKKEKPKKEDHRTFYLLFAPVFFFLQIILLTTVLFSSILQMQVYHYHYNQSNFFHQHHNKRM